MNDNQITTPRPVVLTEAEKTQVRLVVIKIAELIKEKHL